MRIGLAQDPRFRRHVPPGDHPERPARLAAIESALADAGWTARAQPLPVRPATRAELERVHTRGYLDQLEAQLADASEPGWLDADTYYSPGSWEAALCAAGTVLDLARAVLSGALDGGLALVRPPGHATADRAMGFCLLNNVAVAAAALVAEGARVAIVDFDVHHGNGTQDIFWEEPRVLYASTHQFPLYPGTGAVGERGAGGGRGATLNVPLPTGAGDAALLAAYDQVILPAIASFRPDALIVSAGFDAHRDDPLAGLKVSERGFARLTHRLREVAGGRLVAALEGGYDLPAIGRSAVATFAALAGEPLDEPVAAGAAPPIHLAEQHAIARARRSFEELRPPGP